MNKTTDPRTFDVTPSMLGRPNALGTVTVVNAWSNRVDGTFEPGGHFTTPLVPAKKFYLGVAQEAETFSNFSTTSSNFAAAVTDKTGTGIMVFASAPTLINSRLENTSVTSLTNEAVGPSKVVITDSNGREIGANLDGLSLAGNTLSIFGPWISNPWTADVNAAQFALTNAGRIASGNFTGNGAGITNVGGIKIYRGLLNQAGTAAPTDTVLENSLGGTISWARSGVGTYSGSLVGRFTAGKTIVLLTFDSSANAYGGASRSTSDSITLTTYEGGTGNAADGKLSGASLQILVYP